MNPVGRYVALMLERWVSAERERGLERLKARVGGGWRAESARSARTFLVLQG